MHSLEAVIQGHVGIAWLALAIAFAVLAKSASFFVDGAIGIANALRIPRLIIGIVLVSLATTAPELAVSMMAALKGSPEMALGNAIGSVICDDGLALPLCALLAPAAIPVIPRVLHAATAVLAIAYGLCFWFLARTTPPTLSRGEGAILIGVFLVYAAYLYWEHRSGHVKEPPPGEEEAAHAPPGGKAVGLFLLGLGGILLASEVVIVSAQTIALSLRIPETVVALTLVAIGTSIPEIATCIVAARKGEGALAVGNILGADILNICWVAGASAVANDLTIGRREFVFMFPWMFAIVVIMLAMLRWNYSLTRAKGWVLLGIYGAYLISLYFVFPPT